MTGPVVEARGVSKTFPMPAGPITALHDVTLEIHPGEHVAIMGPSGCGKSTLLHVLGCVEPPSGGQLWFGGRDVSDLSDAERSRIRLERVGFVFQRFFLLPMLTARDNIELSMGECGLGKRARAARATELLNYVGLAHRACHRPPQLFGGEMQRVAIARALANRSPLLLADEPTGELDEETGQQVVDLLDRVHADGNTVVVVTHDQTIAARASRTLRMRDGRLFEDGEGAA